MELQEEEEPWGVQQDLEQLLASHVTLSYHQLHFPVYSITGTSFLIKCGIHLNACYIEISWEKKSWCLNDFIQHSTPNTYTERERTLIRRTTNVDDYG